MRISGKATRVWVRVKYSIGRVIVAGKRKLRRIWNGSEQEFATPVRFNTSLTQLEREAEEFLDKEIRRLVSADVGDLPPGMPRTAAIRAEINRHVASEFFEIALRWDESCALAGIASVKQSNQLMRQFLADRPLRPMSVRMRRRWAIATLLGQRAGDSRTASAVRDGILAKDKIEEVGFVAARSFLGELRKQILSRPAVDRRTRDDLFAAVAKLDEYRNRVEAAVTDGPAAETIAHRLGAVFKTHIDLV
jgi:hypothetical protein